MGQPLTTTPPTLTTTSALRIGIVGCGVISGTYLETIARLDSLELVAVADLDVDRAAAVAAEQGVRALTVAALVADPGVDLVLNLTIPAAHAGIALQAIEAGKHVYGEKPLATTTAEAREVVAAAAAAAVRLGCAPDTVLGTGIQTARAAIDDGLIGAPIAATATMVTPGHERWHPNPDFFYQPGGGPLLDMGPYYVTALVTLLGPVTSVIGAASRTRAKRTITSGARAGEEIPVDVDSHVSGVLVHESGVLSTLVMSFDAVATNAAPIEVHGTLGSLEVPDPNHFAGDVRLRSITDARDAGWSTLPVSAGYVESARGYGVADLALARDLADATSTPHRANGELAFHVLDVMESLLESAHTGHAVSLGSSCARPAAVPLAGLRSTSAIVA